MRPGISVAPGRSIVTAPAGAVAVAAGPALSMRWPRTTTAQPSCIASPSNTRAGLSTYDVVGRGRHPVRVPGPSDVKAVKLHEGHEENQ